MFEDSFDSVVLGVDKKIDIKKFIDRFEDESPDGLSIDYPMNCSYCQVSIDKFHGVISIESTNITIRYNNCKTPKELVTGLQEVQRLLIDGRVPILQLTERR